VRNWWGIWDRLTTGRTTSGKLHKDCRHNTRAVKTFPQQAGILSAPDHFTSSESPSNEHQRITDFPAYVVLIVVQIWKIFKLHFSYRCRDQLNRYLRGRSDVCVCDSAWNSTIPWCRWFTILIDTVHTVLWQWYQLGRVSNNQCNILLDSNVFCVNAIDVVSSYLFLWKSPPRSATRLASS